MSKGRGLEPVEPLLDPPELDDALLELDDEALLDPLELEALLLELEEELELDAALLEPDDEAPPALDALLEPVAPLAPEDAAVEAPAPEVPVLAAVVPVLLAEVVLPAAFEPDALAPL